MKKNIDRERLSQWRRLTAGLRECMGSERVVLNGTRGATVYGCRRIVYYSPSEICMELGCRCVSVCGTGLYCASFSAGTVCVEGVLEGVFYREGRGTGRR